MSIATGDIKGIGNDLDRIGGRRHASRSAVFVAAFAVLGHPLSKRAIPLEIVPHFIEHAQARRGPHVQLGPFLKQRAPDGPMTHVGRPFQGRHAPGGQLLDVSARGDQDVRDLLVVFLGGEVQGGFVMLPFGARQAGITGEELLDLAHVACLGCLEHFQDKLSDRLILRRALLAQIVVRHGHHPFLKTIRRSRRGNVAGSCCGPTSRFGIA